MRYINFYIINILIIYSFSSISHLIQLFNEKDELIYYLKYSVFSQIKFHNLHDNVTIALNSQ